MSAAIAANLLLLVLAGLLLRAAVIDILTFDISNELNGLIMALAPFWWAANDLTFGQVGWTLIAAGIVFVCLTFAFYLGAMGGGDVKMAPAVLLWFPAGQALDFIVVMSAVGGLVTVLQLVGHRVARRQGRPEIPYGVAIAAAGLWLIAERYLYQFS